MLTTKQFKRQYGGNVCRHCINDETGVHLTPEDCRYEKEYSVCPRCRLSDKHLVKGFSLAGLMKLAGK